MDFPQKKITRRFTLEKQIILSSTYTCVFGVISCIHAELTPQLPPANPCVSCVHDVYDFGLTAFSKNTRSDWFTFALTSTTVVGPRRFGRFPRICSPIRHVIFDLSLSRVCVCSASHDVILPAKTKRRTR